jgi:signal transduction histidine kinase
MKKNHIILICLLLFTRSLLTQTSNHELNALVDSARNYIYSNKIKSYQFASKLKTKALDIDNKTALAYTYHIFGVIDENHGDNDAAYKNYTTALNYASLSKDKVVKLRILIALSNYYLKLSQTDKAIETCQQGTKEAIKSGNSEIASQFYNNLSLAHSYIEEFDKALIYSDKSIKLKEKLKDEESLANAYLNKGLILTNKADYENGFKYYRLAEELFLKHNTYQALTQTHINFAWDYTDLKQFKKARKHLGKALYFAEKSDDKIRQAGTWNVLGYYYKSVGHIDSVTYALEKGLELSLEAENKRNALVAYQELSNHYQNIGKTNLALEYLTKAFKIKDIIFDESKIQLSQSLNARYETEKKEEQIKLLNTQQENDALIILKQRWTLISISLFLVLISILTFILFTNYHKKQQQKTANELQSQKEAERIRIARDMHDDIGAGLTRIVMRSEQVKQQLQLGNAIKNGIVESLEKMASESRLLSHNIGEIIWALNPKNDTLDNLFAYIRNYAVDFLEEANITSIIQFPENIPGTSVSPELRRNIFLIVKESLNNVVKHAEASEVVITLLLFQQHLSIMIKDNGKGVDEDRMRSDRNGLSNLEKRTLEMGGKFTIQSNPLSGTEVKVEQVSENKKKYN